MKIEKEILEEIKQLIAIVNGGFNKYEMYGVLFKKDGSYTVETYGHECPDGLCIYNMVKNMVDEGWEPVKTIWDEDDAWTSREYQDGGISLADAIKTLGSKAIRDLSKLEIKSVIKSIEKGDL